MIEKKRGENGENENNRSAAKFLEASQPYETKIL